MSLTDVPPGTLLLDKYRVVGTLGKGGMGCVYEVVHELTRHTRAMKLLHAAMRDTPGAVERFLREASAAGRIGDPHIIDTYDAGVMPSGEAYLVMEILEGEPLSALLKRSKGGLPITSALDLVIQACDGVDAAHRASIVHRDLKPANLFIVEREGKPFVKVLDFGISKFSDGDLDQLTQAGQLMGTPAYMPPEQLLGKEVDLRADVYALGIILYRCVTGRAPYAADSLMQLALLVSQGQYESVRALRPEAPEALEAIVARCMARAPADRYPSAAALAEALREAQADLAEAGSSEAVTIALQRSSAGASTDPTSTHSAPSEVQPPSVSTGTERGSHVLFPGTPEQAAPAPRRQISTGLVIGAIAAGCLVAGLGYALTRGAGPAAASSVPAAAPSASAPPSAPPSASTSAPAPAASSAARSPAPAPDPVPSATAAPAATPALPPPSTARSAATTRPAVVAPPVSPGLATENPYR